jgi:hypothetical protein
MARNTWSYRVADKLFAVGESLTWSRCFTFLVSSTTPSKRPLGLCGQLQSSLATPSAPSPAVTAVPASLASAAVPVPAAASDAACAGGLPPGVLGPLSSAAAGAKGFSFLRFV